MKPFHFYVDSDQEEFRGYHNLMFPFCKTSKGYGIFYWGLDRMGFIKSIDYRGLDIHAYFENNGDIIKNFDDEMGRSGKKKLQEWNDSKFIKSTIQQIFTNEDMLKTMNMWSKT